MFRRKSWKICEITMDDGDDGRIITLRAEKGLINYWLECEDTKILVSTCVSKPEVGEIWKFCQVDTEGLHPMKTTGRVKGVIVYNENVFVRPPWVGEDED